MSSYFLDNFLRESSEAIARQTDSKLVVDAVGENLRRLLASSFFLDESRTRPDKAAIVRHELHRDERFTVTACVFAPQQSTPIHEHASWGVLAGVSNRLLAITYRRLDDGLAPGFASLAEVTRTLVTETSFAFLRPPEEAIHRLENPFRDPAVTLHVLGVAGDGVGADNVFDLKAKSVISGLRPELAGV